MQVVSSITIIANALTGWRPWKSCIIAKCDEVVAAGTRSPGIDARLRPPRMPPAI
jgi:hypothetical protein